MKAQDIAAPVTARRRAVAWTLALAIGLPGAALAAQEVVTSTPYAVVPEVDVTVRDGNLELSLEDAIVISLRRNLGLQVQRYRRNQAVEAIRRAQGIFDLGLVSAYNINSDTQPAASQLQGADITETDVEALNVNLAQLTPAGGRFTFDWRNVRQESNNIFQSINPSFTINMDALFTQPLLAGFGETATKRGILVARNDSDLAVELLEQAVISDVDQVESAYWALVEAQEQLTVSLEALELAKELHNMNTIQVEVGTLAPLELIQSEVGVAQREEEVLRADVLARDNADVLRQLLNLEENLWDYPILPTPDPRIPRIEIGIEAAIEVALQARSEIQAQLIAIENLEIDSDFFRHFIKPRLDLQLRYGFNGLGGDVQIGNNPFDPRPRQTLEGGWSDAFQQVLDRDFEGWAAGLEFAYPIRNREAKGNSAIADLALEEGLTTLEDLRLAVLTEVRRTARAVDTAAEAIDLAEITTELATRNLDAEQKRYENGLSTSFQVLEIQEDLTQARSREVTSIAAYRRALVLFYRAIGQLLQENGIELEDTAAAQ
ncbi:MAG: TolC family protein [Thermoanaerobaculia bacterium]|nr:TolC family protein [Thermoanaerobaculia bacterium]